MPVGARGEAEGTATTGVGLEVAVAVGGSGVRVGVAVKPAAIAVNDLVQLEVASAWQRIHPAIWLNCWTAMDGQARMVLTSERIFLCGDQLAQRQHGQEHELRLRAMRVETVDPSELRKLEELVQVKQGEVRSGCIRNRHRDGHVVLRAALLTEMAGMQLVGITFRDADSDFQPVWVDLGSVFGLTSAETRTVEMLLGGASPEAIGEAQDVSINTIRSHISHVYEKLQISSREELWRKLAPYRLN